MEEESQNTILNVRDWIVLSTVMIGAVLTILALVWQVPPTRGIVTVTFLLMVAFILFVNSVSANSRAQFELRLEDFDEIKVNRFVSFAEYRIFYLRVCLPVRLYRTSFIRTIAPYRLFGRCVDNDYNLQHN